MTSADLTTIINVLSTYSSDLNGCLVNCSNKGVCKLGSNNLYKCSCQQYFTGSSCQLDIRPCSISPCLNNGTCVESNSSFSSANYTCNCMASFYGDKCENQIDLCQFKDCSGNGVCYANITQAACKCFQFYYGDNCENQKNELISIKTVITMASVIAIITIILIYVLFVVLDLLRIYVMGRVSFGKLDPYLRRKLKRYPIKKKKKTKKKYRRL